MIKANEQTTFNVDSTMIRADFSFLKETPLDYILFVALANEVLLNEQIKGQATEVSEEISRQMIGGVPEDIESYDDQKKGYKTIELAGIAKFFEEINKSEDEEVVYENTIGMTLHGIDAVTKTNDGSYTVYEIKATTRDLRSPRSYLRKTKHKGRQLSWQWCWASLVDMAEFPLTAPIFLELYVKMIERKIKRKLAIVECKKEHDGSFTGTKLHIFDFESLGITDDSDLSKQRKMLAELRQEGFV